MTICKARIPCLLISFTNGPILVENIFNILLRSIAFPNQIRESNSEYFQNGPKSRVKAKTNFEKLNRRIVYYMGKKTLKNDRDMGRVVGTNGVSDVGYVHFYDKSSKNASETWCNHFCQVGFGAKIGHSV